MKLFTKYSVNKTTVLYISAAIIFVSAAFFGVSKGSTDIAFDVISDIFSGTPLSAGGRILLYARIPRVLACLFAGAALSLSGAVLQTVLGNKLASPSVIGVNSGAGFAVTLISALGIFGGISVALSSFIGACVSMIFISVGIKRWSASRGTVILMGAAVNALFGALSDIVISFFPDTAIISREFRTGDFSSVTYERLIPLVFGVTVCFIFLLLFSRELDLLSLGEEKAKSLGADTLKLRIIFLLLSSLLAALSVSVAGLVSFVGLMVPHIVRYSGLRGSKRILPLCAMLGGGFLCYSDTLARTLFSPYEIPVGIITALLGAPFFIFILIREKGGNKNA